MRLIVFSPLRRNIGLRQSDGNLGDFRGLCDGRGEGEGSQDSISYVICAICDIVARGIDQQRSAIPRVGRRTMVMFHPIESSHSRLHLPSPRGGLGSVAQ